MKKIPQLIKYKIKIFHSNLYRKQLHLLGAMDYMSLSTKIHKNVFVCILVLVTNIYSALMFLLLLVILFHSFRSAIFSGRILMKL